MRKKNERDIYRYYSQNGEDCLLWEFFEFKDDGFFIDVGAFDGVYLSNTYSFEQKGWNGICIEPLPEYYELCRRNRPNSVCLNLACIGDPALREVTFNAEASGVFSSINDSDRYHRELEECYATSGFRYDGFTKIDVQAKTLNALLSENPPASSTIDFISIDVETYEAEVLRGFDINLFRPRVVIIEANNTEAEKGITAIMSGQYGYHLARTLHVNLVFVASQEDKNKMQNIPINCAIEKQIHPMGSQYSFTPFIRGVTLTETKDMQLAKRLEILKRNGSNWMACKQENEWLASKESFLQRLEGFYTCLRSIAQGNPKYMIYGVNAIADMLYWISPDSVAAFIAVKPTVSRMYGLVPCLAPEVLSSLEALPIVIACAEDEEAAIVTLVEHCQIEHHRIVTIDIPHPLWQE